MRDVWAIMGVEIRLIHSLHELRDVCRFRYEIYVEEMQRVQYFADHERRMVLEPADASANVFVALDDGRVVGTVRTNYLWRSSLDAYVDMLGVDRDSEWFPEHTSVTSKLMVARHYRNSTLGYRLARATYRRAHADGVLQDFIDVSPHLVPLFKKLGYRLHKPEAQHPEYGNVVVMRIDVLDVEHFEQVGSPFLRLAQAARPRKPGLRRSEVPPDPHEVSA